MVVLMVAFLLLPQLLLPLLLLPPPPLLQLQVAASSHGRPRAREKVLLRLEAHAGEPRREDGLWLQQLVVEMLLPHMAGQMGHFHVLWARARRPFGVGV